MDPNRMRTLQCPNCGAPAAIDSVRCDYCRSVLTAAACPSCFGPVFRGMKHCPECGAPIEPVVALSGSVHACPRCEKPLQAVMIAGIDLEECRDCGGIWLDAASFEQICADREMQEKAAIYPAPPRSPAPEGTAGRPQRYYVPCPVCGELMNRKNFADCSGIVVDVCKAHGLWLDRLELQQIVGFIRDGGLRKSRANQLARLEAEQARLKALQRERPPEADFSADVPLFEHESGDLSLTDLLAGFISRLL